LVRRLLIAATAVAALVAAAPAPSNAALCGTRSGHSKVSKVLWIVMENHSYGDIVGNADAPFENGLARRCGLATNYHPVSSPSLPNYIAMTSGKTYGITDDDPPSSHKLRGASIFSQLSSAWSFEESMPSRCALTSSDPYAVKHNPQAYYLRARKGCRSHNVRLGKLRRKIRSGLPRFSFVTPNLCNDMHDCGVPTGDAWLATWVRRIARGRDYRAGRLAVFVTFDEGGSTVYTAVASQYTKRGARSGRQFTHYSLLKTAEQILGVRRLNGARDARSMRRPFSL
jgi:hypothetical protein